MFRLRSRCCTLFLALAAACSSSSPPPEPPGKTIGPGGGTVSSSDGKVSLVFPPNALAQDTRIEIQPVTTPSETYLVPGTTYALGPDGTEFAHPVTATFHYDPSKLPSGADESRLQVTKLRNDGQRLSAPSTVDTSAHTVAGQITGFSTHSVVCCIPPRTPTDFFGSYDGPQGVIHLTWNLVLLGGLNPTSELRIERAETILPLDSDFHPLVTLTEADPTFATGFDDPGVGVFHPNLPVWYRISGAAGVYVDAPSTAFVLIPPASGTLTLTAAAQSTTSVLLSWNDMSGVSDYQLERDSGPGFSVIATLANTALQFTDTGLTPSTAYNYRLTANLSVGGTAIATAGAITLGAVVGGHIYVTDRTRIVRMDDINGNGWKPLTGKADGTDAFTAAWGIVVDARGAIYVADGNRVVKTDIDGSTWTTLSHNAAGTDSFFSLEGIALDASGNIYVTDWGGVGNVARVVRTDITGSSWTALGTTRGSSQGQFACPGMVAVVGSDIFVADRCNSRIVRTDITGTNWTTLASKAGGGDSFSSPRGIGLDPSGAVWVADEGNHRLVKTTLTGSPWTPVAVPTGAPPTALAIDPAGPVYASSYQGNYLVQVAASGNVQFTQGPGGDTFTNGARGVAFTP